MQHLKKILELDRKLNPFFLTLVALATRLMVGYGFYSTGSGKLKRLDGVTEFFHSLGIPFPAEQAWFVAHMEYFGGMLLVVGLFTRFFSGMLASTMVVALLTADKEDFLKSWDPSGDSLPVEVTAWAYLVYLGWLAVYGAGKLSIDGILGFFLHRKLKESDDQA